MTTFVILSDSHGRRGAVDRIRPLFAENDLVVHLGDGMGDMREAMAEFPDKVHVLRGNCDFSYGPEEEVIERDGLSVLCCHGHRYGVKSGLSRLAERAKALDCEVALYGHTHRADISEVDGVLCINPGAIGSYADPGYAYLVIHKGKATATLVPLT